MKPSAASAASAAVAATATSSATNGLCRSFTNASLASNFSPELDRPPPLLDDTRATDVPDFFALPPFEPPLLPLPLVAFFAISLLLVTKALDA